MKSKPHFRKAEIDEIVKLISEKLKADSSKQKGIRDKIRRIGFYGSDYGFRDGYTVAQFLSVAKIKGNSVVKDEKLPIKKVISQPTTTLLDKGRTESDEAYIIDLCDEFSKQKALRQHRFDFLLGDSGTKLPVDAYYPSLNLVIEFCEKQHTETVKFFDKRLTVSGIGRGEQRKLYDQRRRDVLPKQGIQLIEFDYSDFKHSKSKKLLRNREEDMKVVEKRLKENNY